MGAISREEKIAKCEVIQEENVNGNCDEIKTLRNRSSIKDSLENKSSDDVTEPITLLNDNGINNKKTTTLKVLDNKPKDDYKLQLVWLNIILFIILHSSIPFAIYKIYSERPWKTVMFSVLGIYISALGVTGGSHRLWSHRAYKARWPVELILMFFQTMAGQNSIYTWSRDHRLHHKFSETNADPHNIHRGFFFAHIGWLCCRKHPDVLSKGKTIDMSDLEANPIVSFQHKHFWWLSLIFNLALPVGIPCYFWNEKLVTSFLLSFLLRYILTLHGTWLVNSAAHSLGHRPYDKRIEARESMYVILTGIGEGFHNYHHTFPYDYSTGEFGKFMNITTTFIDLCAAFDLAYDLRKVDKNTIDRRKLRTGEKISENEAFEISNRLLKSSNEDDQVEDDFMELPYISGKESLNFTM